MNIESLLEKTNLFDDLVVSSGFKRDIGEYITAIQQPQTRTNLVSLKEIADKVINEFQKIQDSSLPEAMNILLPQKKEVFTDSDHLIDLEALMEDPEIDTNTFFDTLNTTLTELSTEINSDFADIEKLRTVFAVYVQADKKQLAIDNKAVLSIIFKDLETIKSLKKFSRSLDRWNRTLLIYHQLVKSESPEDIELLEVQNGSIDVIFNIDVNVALDLAALITVGMKVFTIYLLYKSKVHEIVLGYYGNKKLIEGEKQRESLLLDNIKDAVKVKLLEQHKTRIKKDKNINKESIDSKITGVTDLITEHIIKGNEVKLLAAPKLEDDSDEDVIMNESRQLNEQTQKTKTLIKQLSPNEMKLLSEKYEIKDE